MKLVLGTANLNQSYGLLKQKTKFSESLKILAFAKNRIKYIDTASSYKGFNKLIIKSNLKKFQINTKISKINGNSYETIKINIYKEVDYYLKLYKKKKINILFLHRARVILSKKKGSHVLRVLKNLKKENKIRYYGYSTYSPAEIKSLIKVNKPDFIQAPLSIFDQRMINSGMLKHLKKKKIKFQARSIYLQGILTDENIIHNKKFIKNKLILKNWFKWLKENKYKPENVLINFIKNYKKYLDSVIISAKKINQIKSNYVYFKKKTKYHPYNISSINTKVIDPRKW